MSDPSADSARPGQAGPVVPRNRAAETVEHTTGRRVGIRLQTYMGLFGSVLAGEHRQFRRLRTSWIEIVEYQSRLAVQSIPNLSRDRGSRPPERQPGERASVRMVSASTSWTSTRAVSRTRCCREREELLGVVQAIERDGDLQLDRPTGCAGAAGHVSEALLERGVPVLRTAAGDPNAPWRGLSE